jgi:putative effector of murein hydrolase
MLALSGLLLLLEICGKSSWAEQTFLFLQPGQQFLVKWSALFFLPSMVELPVVLGEGFSAWVIGRMLIYIVIGWLIHITLLVTISSLLHRAKRAFTETSKPEASNLEKHDVESSGSLSCAAEHDPAPKADQSPADMSDVSVQQCTPVPIVSNDDDGRARLEPPTWPFNASLLVFLAVLFIIGFSMAPSKTGECLFLLSAAIAGANIAGLLPPNYRLILAPVLVALAFTFTAAFAWSLLTNFTFMNVLKQFNKCDIIRLREDMDFRGDIMHFGEGLGAGSILSSCLPAFVMSLSLVVFQQRKVLWQNIFGILGTCICGALLGLFGASALTKAFFLPSDLARPSSMRFFSVPLALQGANALHASDAMTASYAVASGLLGATLGWPWVRKLCRVRDASIMGASIGGASHGQGTAMLASFNPEATAFSSVSFVITGVLGSLLVRLPFIAGAIIGITG